MSELRERMPLAVLPALVFLNGAGDVLHRQYARLYPAYDATARALPGWSESLMGLEDLLALVTQVERAMQTEAVRIRTLEERSDADARVSLADIHAGRCQPERARGLLDSVLAEGEHEGASDALAALDAGARRPRRAAEIYERLLGRHPDHQSAERWRHVAARIELEELLRELEMQRRDDSASATDERLASARRALRRLAHATENPELAIEGRLSLADAAHALGDDEALKIELVWLADRLGCEETCRAPWTGPRLLHLIELEECGGEVQRGHAHAHLRQLMHTFPDSSEAQRAKHGMLGGPIRVGGPAPAGEPAPGGGPVRVSPPR